MAITNANAGTTGADRIDVAVSGANFKMQFMFIVAFLVNVVAAFWIARKRSVGHVPLSAVFTIFWLIDAFVP